ncbi:DUF397 domain-containing protein [Streptomyces sp. I6]|uniref:DUF397 domain-containing protein n=1 Tax=Streptomyces sp. I6 TaxID=2483113 RepID=UPI000F457E4F|nr:DUF397 domain-containing protein [Streptomyces sp. I6]RNL72007.1 DUF397 domain-containing protein [Streptomyces sp. I6]
MVGLRQRTFETAERTAERSVHPSTVRRRRSSSSKGTGGQCREVADGTAHVVPVRDSEAPHGPVLAVGAGAWSPFVGAIRSGKLTR